MEHKKISRRDFIKAAGFTATASLLAACAPQVVTQVVNQTQVVTQVVPQTAVVTQVVNQTEIVNQVVTATPAPTAVPAPATLDIWAITTVADLNAKWEPDPNNEEFKKEWWTGGMIRLQANAFLAKHPGTTLKITGHSWDWDLRQNEYLALAAGIIPDTSYGEAYVTEFMLLGIYQPLDAAVAALFPTSTYRAMTGGVDGKDGKAYGLPETTGANVLFVNNEVLKKAGQDPAKPPSNWDELLASSQAIQKVNKNAFFTYLDEQESIGSILRISAFFESNNTPIGSDVGVPTINTPGAADVWVWLSAMLHTSDKNVLQQMEAGSEGGSAARFNDGTIAYKIGWTNDATTVGTADKPVDAQAIQLPHPVNGKQASNLVGNQINSAFAHGPNPELAKEYIQLSVPDEAAQILKPNGCGIWIPALKSMLEQYATFDKLGGFKSDVSKAIVRVTMQAALDPGTGPIPGWPKNGGRIWNAWNDMYGKIWKSNPEMKKEDIQKLLDDLQKTVEGLVAKTG